MRKPIIAIKLGPRNYAGLINLGNRLFNNMSGSLIFVTPAPALAVLQAAVTAVVNSYAVWAPVGGRGSHSDLLDLRNKSLTLYNLIKAEADYVQTTAQIAAGNDYSEMATIIGASGFGLKGDPTPQGVLDPVVGFRKMVSSNLNPNQVKFRWKRPLNTPKGNVYLYRVMRAATTSFATAVQVATTSKTSFIDTNETGAVQTYTYWIVPVNNEGDGATSVAVTVSILG